MTVRFLALLGQGPVDPSLPVVRADDAGFTRGDGCFEGLRVIVGTDCSAEVADLDAHLARMSRSAAALELPFEPAAWRRFVLDSSAHWQVPGEYSMKLVLSRGADTPLGVLMLSDLPADQLRQRRDGLRVITLTRGMGHDAFASAPWLLGGVKTLSYAVNMAAYREAQRRGCDDVIFLSAQGTVLEAPTSSVVWARGRALFTIAPGASGILASTTQRLLFERASAAGWECAEVEVRLAELHAAEIVWLISSVRGPVDLAQLDGRARVRRPEIDAEIRRLAGFHV